MHVKADLHIHSCLSPCGSLEMSPSKIIDRARETGLSLIALTDHNSALNCPAIEKIAGKYNDITVIFGMEITTSEEIHALALFESVKDALEMSEFIYSRLSKIPNNPDKMGDQVYVDEEENILGEVDIYLGGSVSLDIVEIGHEIHRRNGLFIPSHIDREYFSMKSQLGYLPVGEYDAIEFSNSFVRRKADAAVLDSKNQYAQITSSDAHYSEDIGRGWIEFDSNNVSFQSLRDALLSKKILSCAVKKQY